MARNYAYRPSQGHLAYVTNSKGEKVPNRAHEEWKKKNGGKKMNPAKHLIPEVDNNRGARLMTTVRNTLDSDIQTHIDRGDFLSPGHISRVKQFVNKGLASSEELNPNYTFDTAPAFGADGGRSLWKASDSGRESDAGFGFHRGYGYVNQDGKLHSTDGRPARYTMDGSVEWYKNGLLHNENGPAAVSATTKSYYLNGEPRDAADGPAHEYSDGTAVWLSKGKPVRRVEANGTVSTYDHNGNVNNRWNDKDPTVKENFDRIEGPRVKIREEAYAKAEAFDKRMKTIESDLAKTGGYTEKYVLYSQKGLPIQTVDSPNAPSYGGVIRKAKVKTTVNPWAYNMSYDGDELYKYDVKDIKDA